MTSETSTGAAFEQIEQVARWIHDHSDSSEEIRRAAKAIESVCLYKMPVLGKGEFGAIENDRPQE